MRDERHQCGLEKFDTLGEAQYFAGSMEEVCKGGEITVIEGEVAPVAQLAEQPDL